MAGLIRLVLPGSLWADMETDVRRKYPEEACGILAGHSTQDLFHVQAIFPMENILHSSRRFRINPQQQVECLYLIQSSGMDLIAIYHSHPNGDIQPSETDQTEHFDPAAASLIWHLVEDRWECRAYILNSQKFTEILIEIHR